MIRGLYTSSVGMISQMNKMDVISNNIANADNSSFKRDIVVTRPFSEEMMHRLNDSSNLMNAPRVGKVSLGVFVDEIYTDFSDGSFTNTSSSLDLAITGDGFFSVEVLDKDGNASEKYTRDGSFTLSSDGVLVTKSGDVVLGQNGPITLGNDFIVIDTSGNVYSGDEFVDTLKLVDFEDLTLLRNFGDNLYDALDEAVIKQFEGNVLQSYLENSNVNSVKEMVELITTARVYEANQKMVSIHDTILGKAVTEIGKK